MNYSFLSQFFSSRKENKVMKTVDHIRKHPIFRRARFDLYTPTLHPQRLIVLLGQMHTIWKSDGIGNRVRKRIVACQARLCSYCAYFQQFHEVKEFGGEGMYEGLQTRFHDERSFHLYVEILQQLQIKLPIRLEQIASSAREVLKILGRKWHEALRKADHSSEVQRYAAAVSGLTLFQFLNTPRAHVFPVEGEKAYQKVLMGVNELGERIHALEKGGVISAIRQRGGKVKTEKEAELVIHYNALLKEFQRILESDIRERATMTILKKKSQQLPVTVFIMGVGHRRNYLKLVDEYLKDTPTAFLFITPPELLVNWWIVVGIPLLLALILLGINAVW